MPSSLSALRGGNKQSYLVLQVGGLTALSLSSDQLVNRTIEFAGALTANLTITLNVAQEDQGLHWQFVNSCTGAFITLIQGPTGANYILSQGVSTQMVWNGSALVPVETGDALRSDAISITGITGASPTTVLTNAQAAATTIFLLGNPSGTPVLQIPPRVMLFVVVNQLGATVTVKTAAGNSVTVANSVAQWVVCDALNVTLVA